MPAMSVSPEEVARFDALAATWWKPNGPMRALHRMNPARIQWIVERSALMTAPNLMVGCCPGKDLKRPGCRGIHLLDVGCGAGVAAEALARCGFNVLGLDAAGEAIAAARVHADGNDLPLSYRIGTAEDLLAEGRRFPVITALEVIEHVANPPTFLGTLRDLLAPGLEGAWLRRLPFEKGSKPW